MSEIEMATGSELIAAERRRQMEAEGWTPAHDAEHSIDALALAAISYATPPGTRDRSDSSPHWPPVSWPWADRFWKPTPDNRVRELVKAGALIAAEIDRLQAVSR